MQQEIAVMYAAYALLLIVGGAAGRVKAKSNASLISGGITGLIALVLAGISLNVAYQAGALICGAVLALGLGVFFIMRLLKTRKPMPAIPMAILSAAVGIASIIILNLRRGA